MITVFILWCENESIIDVYGAEKWLNILNRYPSINASKLSIYNLSNLDQCDVFIIPGGEPYQMRIQIGGMGAKYIRKFVANGGRYIGVCAGAVLAIPKSPSLDLLTNVKTVNDNIWWNSGLFGKIKLKVKCRSALDSYFCDDKLFSYMNGPLLNIKKNKLGKMGVPIPLAAFDGDLLDVPEPINREMSNQIDGSLAIIYGQLGDGSVIISSIHPEYSNDHFCYELVTLSH